MKTFKDLGIGGVILRAYYTNTGRLHFAYHTVKNIEDRNDGRIFYMDYDRLCIPYEELNDCSYKDSFVMYFSEPKTGLRVCCEHVNNTKKDFDLMVEDALARSRDPHNSLYGSIDEEYVKEFLQCN